MGAQVGSRGFEDAWASFGVSCAEHAEARSVWEHTSLSGRQGTRWAGESLACTCQGRGPVYSPCHLEPLCATCGR